MGHLQRMTDQAGASLTAYEPMTLRPASLDCLNVELMACLRLVAPVGMTDDERLEWVKVARETIKDLPEDLLRNGCAEARRWADHHAKIVPIITETVSASMKIRREFARTERTPPERQIERQNVEQGHLQKTLRETGFADVADKLLGRSKPRQHRELKMPTAEDYAALGIDVASASETRSGSTEGESPTAQPERPDTVTTTTGGE